MKLRLPAGYHEYVTELGEGVLGDFIRIYPPQRILKELAEWRQRIDQYWFWDDGKDVLTKQQALESFVIGDTLNGDELIINPCFQERIFVLPHDSEDIPVAGDGLVAAIEWLLSFGEVTDPIKARKFKPSNTRRA